MRKRYVTPAVVILLIESSGMIATSDFDYKDASSSGDISGENDVKCDDVEYGW